MKGFAGKGCSKGFGKGTSAKGKGGITGWWEEQWAPEMAMDLGASALSQTSASSPAWGLVGLAAVRAFHSSSSTW